MVLTVSRLEDIAEVLNQTKREDYQLKQIHSSFLGWQLTANLTAALGRKGAFMNFLEYLEGMGVVGSVAKDSEEAALDKAQKARDRKAEAQRVIAMAEEIVALDQKK